MDDTEYQSRYYGRIYGKRKARVSQNQDPEKRGRIKLENTELYGTGESPWAMPCFPFYGGRDCGFFAVPPIGSLVWVECEEGLAEFPIYTGGYYGLVSDGHLSDGSDVEESMEYQTEKSSVPAHGRGHFDGSDFGNLKGSYGVPASSYEADYGEVTILQTKSGHKLEFDDTSGGERVQIHHAKGAHIEILPDGTIVLATEGNLITRSSGKRETVLGTREELVSDHIETVEGDVSSEIMGNVTSIVKGDQTATIGSVTANIEDLISLDAGGLKATVQNLFDISSGGDLLLTSFGNLDLTSASKGFFSFSNALTTLPSPLFGEDSLIIQGLNGNVTISSSDFLEVSRYGISMRGGLPASSGGHVYLGSLTSTASLLGVTSIPFLKEPVVMGTQLQLFLESILTALDAFFALTNTGGSTPGFGGPNPILATASVTAQIALTTARSTFMNTVNPLILSECVYLSKV
jgi:hypothetical protein